MNYRSNVQFVISCITSAFVKDEMPTGFYASRTLLHNHQILLVIALLPRRILVVNALHQRVDLHVAQFQHGNYRFSALRFNSANSCYWERLQRIHFQNTPHLHNSLQHANQRFLSSLHISLTHKKMTLL